jgi:PAS domain S-box-containing protein
VGRNTKASPTSKDQSAAEKALIASEERYRAFISQSSEGIWRFELEEPMPTDLPIDEQVEWAYKYGYLAECNDAMAKQYGLASASELIGARLDQLLVKDDPNNTEFLKAFFSSGYRLNDAESHERDAEGNDRYFFNNFVGFVENGYLRRAWGTQRDVTQTKLADRDKAMLAAIVQYSDDAIVSLDLNGNIVTWNVAAEHIFGYRSAEAVGRSIGILIPDDRRHEEQQILDKIRQDVSVDHYETVRRRKDGTLLDVSVSVSPIRDAGGNLIGISKITRDVSQRKETERILNENRLMLAMAMQSSRMGVWERDFATEVVTWSPELEDILGLPRGGFGGSEQDFFDFILEEDLNAVKREVRLAVEEKRAYTIEFRFKHTDGSIRWMEGRGEAVYSQTGAPVRLYGIGIDITDRKLAEEKLAKQSTELELLSRMPAENPNPVLRVSPDAKVLYFNDAARPLLEFWNSTGGIPADLKACIRDACATAGKRDIEVNFGPRVVMCTVAPITEAGYVNIYGTDISAQRRTLDALRESEQRFSRFMQQLPGLAWIKDIDGRYVYANDASLKSFGMAKKELYGKTDEQVFPPASAAQFREHDRQAVNSGVGIRVLESLVEDDGVLHYSIVSKFPIAGADGKPALIGGIAIDVTDQKLAEERLRRRMEFDEAVMSNIAEGLFTVDSHGRLTSMNPAAEKLFGWTFEELKGRKMHDIVHYKHRDGSPFPAAECPVLDVVRDGIALINREDVYVRKDGTMFDVLFSSSPLRESGQTSGVVVVFQDITERKQAEEALQRYRHLSEYANDIIWLLRADGRIVEVNQAAVDAYGYSRDELLGMNVRDLRHESTQEELPRHIEEANAGNVHFETLHVRKDGTVFPVEVNASSAEFGGERLIMSIIRDITERKRLERNHEFLLRLSELIRTETDRDALLQDATGLLGEHLELDRCFVSTVDLEAETSTVVVEYRASGTEPLIPTVSFDDYSAENIEIAKAGITIVVPDAACDKRTSRKYSSGYTRDRLRSYVGIPLQREGQWAAILIASRGDPYQWGETEVSLIQTFAERVWLAVEKLRSEAALRESEKRAIEEYQRLLERIVPLAETLGAARDLVTVYRSLHEFISASMDCSGFFVSFYEPERSLRIAAYVWGEGRELDVAELPPMPITPGGGPNSQAILGKRTVITNAYWTKQRLRPHVVLMDTGVDPMSSLVVPMVIQDRVIGTLEVQAHKDQAFKREDAVALEMAANLAAVAIDNIRLIETEARARAEAEAANRMKDEFLSVLSHELRTPLNAMLGWVRILRSGVVDEERIAKGLEIIERNTRQQSSLIEDLLDVSRIISGKMLIEQELIDLVQSLEQAAESVRPLAAARSIEFTVKAVSEPLYLKGDAVRLQQVITNLLQNAIKFTPPGGTVTLDYRKKGQYAVVDVTDTGAGIDPEFLPHIFDRFRQADASTRRSNTGLGLGLTIVRTLVEMHGGTTVASSKGLGKGARFRVRLPLAEEFYRTDPSSLPLVSPNGNSSSLEGVKILIVDDDTDGMLPLRILLEREQAVVTCAVSADEALHHLRSEAFDILISDIGMPEKDGFQLISEVRNKSAGPNHRIKAIAYTAYASEEDKNRVLSAGYQVHLAKPLDFDELMAIVRNFGAGVRHREPD